MRTVIYIKRPRREGRQLDYWGSVKGQWEGYLSIKEICELPMCKGMKRTSVRSRLIAQIDLLSQNLHPTNVASNNVWDLPQDTGQISRWVSSMKRPSDRGGRGDGVGQHG